MDANFLTPREVDLMLRYSHGRAVRLARAGKLPAIFLPDGEIRFDREKLADAIRKMTRPQSAKRMIRQTLETSSYRNEHGGTK